jgi:hypothetical protein
MHFLAEACFKTLHRHFKYTSRLTPCNQKNHKSIFKIEHYNHYSNTHSFSISYYQQQV